MLLPEPLRNGYMHTPSQMVTEHDGDAVGTLLFEGVLHVVDEWQRHLIHIGKKRPYLRRFAIVPRGSMTRREQLAWRRDGKGVKNGT